MNRRFWLIAMAPVAMFKAILGLKPVPATEVSNGGLSPSEPQGNQPLAERVADLERYQKQIAKALPPVGTVLPYAGNTLPQGWLWCDGRELDLKKHPEYRPLADVLGTRFRRPTDHQTICRLPDLRGRVAMGAGVGPGFSPRVLGSQDGHETHTLALEEMPNHHHYVYRHAGAITGNNNGGAAGAGDADMNWEVDDVGDGKNGRTSGVNGRSRKEQKTKAFGLMQPFLVVNFIIRF
jgi:microcystin-dependent protein